MSSSARRTSAGHSRRLGRSTIAASQLAEGQSEAFERLEVAALEEMDAAWAAGNSTAAEHWLARYPDLATRPEAATRLVYEEVCLREERGDEVASEEFYRRFPQWRSELEMLFDCHRLAQLERPATRFPVAGDRLGEFQLLADIDRGAVGRVFLATQPALSDRPLVVKLTPCSGEEHLSLARLQHTNIVPLYLVQDFPADNLRALCMPYLGGTSWSRLLRAMTYKPAAERNGRLVIECLAKASGETPITSPSTGPALQFLSRASYVQAVCWIGACLADALAYAHQRGLVHLDIKPSNVLLAGDGQPMLLDFHLAQEFAPGKPLERIGGTPGYMSPEQAEATRALRAGETITGGLDTRSDVYSAGVLLYESLTGRLPVGDQAVARRDLRKINPAVSRSLSDLVYKCLAGKPCDRYADASELAADLRRHLADLPLRGVPNRSLTERWRKWRRRRPHHLPMAALAIVTIGTVVTFATLFVSHRINAARTALAQGQEHLANRNYAAAGEQFQVGWRAVEYIPGQRELKDLLQVRQAETKGAKLSDALHTLVERLRFVDSFDAVPAEKLRALASGCQEVWQVRSQFFVAGASTGELRADMLDLALLWADLQVRLAPKDTLDFARRDASRLLDEAQSLCGPSPLLALARAHLKTDESATPNHPTIAPRAPWEEFVVGRWSFRAGEWEKALAAFDRALDHDPSAFWPNFYRALATYKLGRYEEALNAASVCVALSPRSAECFYNRGLAHRALGHEERAAADFRRAGELDPTLKAPN